MAHVGIRIPEGLEISAKARKLLESCDQLTADEMLELTLNLANLRVLEGLTLDPKKPPTSRELEIMEIHYDLAVKILKQINGTKHEIKGDLNLGITDRLRAALESAKGSAN